MSAPGFEVVRRAGEEIRPARTIGSGLKTRVNAAACVEIGGIHFVTVEPVTAEHAQRINAAVDAFRVACQAAGYTEREAAKV